MPRLAQDQRRAAQGAHQADGVPRMTGAAPVLGHERLWQLQRRAAPYLFVSPFVLLFCCFMLYPLSRSVVLSFYKAAGPRQMRFVGLGNFRYIVHDQIFWAAVLNTTYFAILFLTLQIPISLFLAILLNSRR